MKVLIFGYAIMILSFIAGFILAKVFTSKKISDLEEIIRYQREVLKK